MPQSDKEFFDEYLSESEKNKIIAEQREQRNISRYLNREYNKGIEEYLSTRKVSGFAGLFNLNEISALYAIMYMNVGMQFSKLYVKYFGSRYTPIIKPENYSILWRDYFRDSGKRIGEVKGVSVSRTQQKELTRVIQRLHRSPEFQALNEREANRILRSQVKGLSETRAKAIVRTEANAAANWASERTALDMYGKDNLKKWWYTSGDERVRDDHVVAGVIYSRDVAIGVDKPFRVGGEEMMRPSSGSIASNNVNCRCDAIFEPITV